MEIYTLDSVLRRTEVIDYYESLIWTERLTPLGDFELILNSTNETRKLLTTGTKLALNESKRVMTVETTEAKVNSDGRSILTVKGRSLEAMLDDRLASDGVSEKWTLTGLPADIARSIFKKICVDGLLSPGDIIPFIANGSLYTPGTIPEPSTSITVDIPHSSVYEAIKQLCEIYNLGLRLVRNLDRSELYFDIYSGNDRTTMQNKFSPVLFSPDLDNLTNVSELTSIAQYKNVAYVFGQNANTIVYADGVDSSVSGFDRRVMYVDATDITDPAGPDTTAALNKKGSDALAGQRRMSALDGEISQSSAYKYGIDYDLGDLVEMRNLDGATNHMRVTEQIFVSDAQGERSYPTLAVDLFITAGSWLSQTYSRVWSSGSLTDYWATE